MSPSQDFDDFNGDKTIIAPLHGRGRPLAQNTFLFFIEEYPERKFPVHMDRLVTVGRKKGLDIHIEDQTVSREHLVLTRKDDSVEIEIKGRNGIVIGERQYQNQVVRCYPPVSFEVGSVRCRLIVHSDSIVVIPPEPVVQGPSPPDSIPSPPSEKQELRPRGPDGRVSSRSTERAYDRVYAPDSGDLPPAPVELKKPKREPGVYSKSRETHTDFGPKIVSGRTRSPVRHGRDFPKTGVLSLAGLLILIIVTGTLFLMWNDAPEPAGENGPTVAGTKGEAPGPGQPSEETAPAVPGGSRGREHAYHWTLIQQAKLLLEEDDPDSARDYLIDIPETSPHYAEARELMIRMARP